MGATFQILRREIPIKIQVGTRNRVGQIINSSIVEATAKVKIQYRGYTFYLRSDDREVTCAITGMKVPLLPDKLKKEATLVPLMKEIEKVFDANWGGYQKAIAQCSIVLLEPQLPIFLF